MYPRSRPFQQLRSIFTVLLFFFLVQNKHTMSSPPYPKTTLWIWPTGLFPRRIVYYLRAKRLTLSILTNHNIHLIPVILSKDYTQLLSLPGFEARPENCSLPIMRVEHGNTKEDVLWIRESIAIMEYLEEVFTEKDGYADLRGSTIQQRARTRDAMSLLGEAIVWSVVGMVHSNPATLSWSGLAKEGMSDSAAGHADGKMKMLLGKLEGWVDEREGCVSLSGKGGDTTIVDVLVMAHVEYIKEVYGVDWVRGHEALTAWCEKVRREEWVIGREDLKRVEESGEWEGVLGQ
jgi:glutathione S-transferase